MAVIDVASVDFAYGKNRVLEDLSLEIGSGELVAMLGPNGVGKTTLVENLLGTLAPARGTVRVLGENPRRVGPSFWSRLGFMSQHWNDHGKWRVKDQLAWIGACYESEGVKVRDAGELLDALGMIDQASAPLGKLSGGQRRRIDFAAALLSRPSLLILDEPTTGLDPVAKAQIHDLICECQDEGTTVLLTTHDLAEAEKIASRIVILGSGSVLADGTAHELRRRLLGSSEITWREGDDLFVHSTTEVEQFVAQLDLESISELTITRPSLEDAYLELVGKIKTERAEQRTAVDARGRIVETGAPADAREGTPE
ncbi:MAG: ABC transporter ATP-binding protein [Flaviflexus sp.]|nr:ABC transporter ATP-binding protein [Flaviflexus sp.]